jgi:drug/metabolite transporter (DMT)-like permease
LLWQLSFSRGDLLMLLATLDWALYSVLLRRWQGYFQVPPLTLLTALVLLGLPLQAPLYLYELSQGLRFAPSSGNLLAIAYTAACASVLAYFLWNQGVRVLGAARAAMSNYLMPVFAALLGSLWLDEQLQHYHWSGAALIFSGLLLAGRGTGFNAPRVPPAATAGAPGRSSV